MLRIVFLFLLLGNIGFYLWSHGHLAGVGLAPENQSEPHRLHEQINPDALTLLVPPAAQETAQADPAPEAPAPATPQPEDHTHLPTLAEAQPEPMPQAAEDTSQERSEFAKAKDAKESLKETAKEAIKEAKKEVETCYQANGIEEAQADSIRRALSGKPKTEWELVPTHQNGRWMVYMGKFPDTEFLDRKRGELRLMNIDFDRAGGNFEPGLSLGRFSSEEAAQRQLAAYARQGVRTARVVQERPEVTTYSLRLPKATPTFRAEVAGLAGKNLLPKALQACSKQ